MVFCPVYYADPYYLGPRYYYTPSVCIETPVLTGYLFCRPAYGHYYFGDYYDPIYVQVGIYPWYMVHERGFGYEPLFVYDRWYYGRRDPGWAWACTATTNSGWRTSTPGRPTPTRPPCVSTRAWAA